MKRYRLRPGEGDEESAGEGDEERAEEDYEESVRSPGQFDAVYVIRRAQSQTGV